MSALPQTLDLRSGGRYRLGQEACLRQHVDVHEEALLDETSPAIVKTCLTHRTLRCCNFTRRSWTWNSAASREAVRFRSTRILGAGTYGVRTGMAKGGPGAAHLCVEGGREGARALHGGEDVRALALVGRDDADLLRPHPRPHEMRHYLLHCRRLCTAHMAMPLHGWEASVNLSCRSGALTHLHPDTEHSYSKRLRASVRGRPRGRSSQCPRLCVSRDKTIKLDT